MRGEWHDARHDPREARIVRFEFILLIAGLALSGGLLLV